MFMNAITAEVLRHIHHIHPVHSLRAAQSVSCVCQHGHRVELTLVQDTLAVLWFVRLHCRRHFYASDGGCAELADPAAWERLGGWLDEFCRVAGLLERLCQARYADVQDREAALAGLEVSLLARDSWVWRAEPSRLLLELFGQSSDLEEWLGALEWARPVPELRSGWQRQQREANLDRSRQQWEQERGRVSQLPQPRVLGSAGALAAFRLASAQGGLGAGVVSVAPLPGALAVVPAPVLQRGVFGGVAGQGEQGQGGCV